MPDPDKNIALTINPAIKTPATIAKKPLRFSIPKTQAAKLPVYAPVTGRGIITKTINPQKPHFSIFSPTFPRVLTTIFSNKFTYHDILLNKS